MIGRMHRAVLLVLAAAFILTIAHAAARLTWTLAGETGATVPDIAAALAAPSAQASTDLSPILALAPFGHPATTAVAAQVVRETDLGLLLSGVVLANPPENSNAIIASNGGPAKVYGLGDTVDGRAVVEGMTANKVMLSVSGRLETLSFPKPGTAANSGVAQIVAGLGGNVGVAVAPEAGSAAPAMERLRQRILDNPQSMLDSFSITSSAEGYHVEAGAPPNVLRTGLRPGDLIAKVNGQKVGDIERDRRLVDSVISAGQVRIEVVRDGRNVVMTFPLQ